MILITYLRIMLGGTLARLLRELRNGDCPCDLCRDHRAFVAAAPAVREVPERAADGEPFACVTCGARTCATWPASCAACKAPGPSRAYLPTLAEQRRRRHL